MLPTPRDWPRRSLNKKESQLYAPLANIGSVVMDQDAMYIDIGRANYTRKENLLLEDGGGGGGGAAAGSDEDGDGSSSDDEVGGGWAVELGGSVMWYNGNVALESMC